MTGQWFSPVSSINKTDRHDITEILLNNLRVLVLYKLDIIIISSIVNYSRHDMTELLLILR